MWILKEGVGSTEGQNKEERKLNKNPSALIYNNERSQKPH